MDIDDIIANAFETTKQLMISRTRTRNDADARKFAMWYRISELGETLKSSASKYGRDHTTALWARDTVPGLIEMDKGFRLKAEDAIKRLESIKI